MGKFFRGIPNNNGIFYQDRVDSSPGGICSLKMDEYGNEKIPSFKITTNNPSIIGTGALEKLKSSTNT